MGSMWRAEAASTVATLQRMGIEVIMLTGDSRCALPHCGGVLASRWPYDLVAVRWLYDVMLCLPVVRYFQPHGSRDCKDLACGPRVR